MRPQMDWKALRQRGAATVRHRPPPTLARVMMLFVRAAAVVAVVVLPRFLQATPVLLLLLQGAAWLKSVAGCAARVLSSSPLAVWMAIARASLWCAAGLQRETGVAGGRDALLLLRRS